VSSDQVLRNTTVASGQTDAATVQRHGVMPAPDRRQSAGCCGSPLAHYLQPLH